MLEDFIDTNTGDIIELTTGDYESDLVMVRGVKSQNLSNETVLSWMQQYSLLRGKKAQVRQQLGRAFISFAKDQARKERDLNENFKELFGRLFCVHPQSWLSATSKLLWCCYPEEGVIYDAYAYKSLSILEKIHPALLEIDKMPGVPNGGKNLNINEFSAFYDKYCERFVALLDHHANDFQTLVERFPDYQYPTRYLDKYLWLLGK